MATTRAASRRSWAGSSPARAPNQFPKFDIDASVKAESGSQSFSGTGGLISTGNQAFVNFQGTDYAVPQQLYDEFTTTYAQLQGQNSSGKSANLLKALNISPANWLTDLKNEGTADVEGTQDDPHLRIGERLQAGRGPEGDRPEGGERGRQRQHPAARPAQQRRPVGRHRRVLGRERQAAAQVPDPRRPEAAAPGRPGLRTRSPSTSSSTSPTSTSRRPSRAPANAQPLNNLFQSLGVNPGQLGNALRGGLGTSGALPESGGSTTAPSTSGVQAYEQCLSQASGIGALAEVRRPAHSVADLAPQCRRQPPLRQAGVACSGPTAGPTCSRR